MWIKPLFLATEGGSVRFDEMERLPLPPWSGVPVALDMEVDGATLARAVQLTAAGTLYAQDEENEPVHCAALVDAMGSHTCETDSVLRLVQCGPFEYDREPEDGAAL
jgi:hypothetical protein